VAGNAELNVYDVALRALLPSVPSSTNSAAFRGQLIVVNRQMQGFR
jgi:hypothetical protein